MAEQGNKPILGKRKAGDDVLKRSPKKTKLNQRPTEGLKVTKSKGKAKESKPTSKLKSNVKVVDRDSEGEGWDDVEERYVMHSSDHGHPDLA